MSDYTSGVANSIVAVKQIDISAQDATDEEVNVDFKIPNANVKYLVQLQDTDGVGKALTTLTITETSNGLVNIAGVLVATDILTVTAIIEKVIS